MSKPTPSLLRVRDVMARTGLPRSSLYAQIAKGKFPAPVKLSERCAAWPSDAVDRWILERVGGLAA